MANSTRSKRRAPVSKHPLVGFGLHWKNADGEVINQASIVDIVPNGDIAGGDLALIQYYDWIMGYPSTQRLIPLAELASSDQWVLYHSVNEMNEHYERVDEPRNEQIHQQREKAEQSAG
jgi:hypothetical protein